MFLDTSSLMYRAFFALPTSIKGPDGQPVNAVRGYLDMTARLVRDHAPDEVVHCLDDDWRPAGRVEAYPGYKADRPEEPPELTTQFRLLDDVLGALGQTVAAAPGWEADDAIGTLCTQADPSDEIAVVTGDRDLIQLVRDDGPVVRVLFTVKGVSELAVLDESAVVERHGIPAHRYVDYATLRGDPSDGLPGVKGVGEKTARALVVEHASLEAIVEAAGSQRPAVARALSASGEYLRAMGDVVPVRRDATIEVRAPERDRARLDALGERHNLAAPIGRLLGALDA
jgi:5'-3' exonuclease